MTAPLPENEAARLEALYECKILDTAPEKAFDEITRLAAYICGTPIALVSLIDEHRQWFKSKVGIDTTETPRDVSFCAYVILQTDVLIVPNALEDERFATNPLVTSEPYIRFYAGVPLITPSGYALGSLCVIDYVPRELIPEHLAALQTLAQQVVTLIELRHNISDLKRATVELQARKQKRQRFFTQIAAGFGLASAILFGIGLVSYRSLTSLVQTSQWQIQHYKVLTELGDIRFQMQNAALARHRYITTGEERYLEPYYNTAEGIDREIEQLQQTIANNPDQKRRLATLLPLVTRKFTEIEQTNNLRRTRGFEAASEAVLVQNAKNLSDALETAIREMEKAENVLLTQRSLEAEAKARQTILTFSIGIFLTFFILTAVYYLIYREITERKQTEATLHQERDFTFAVMNTTGALIVVLDSQGRIVRFNLACEQITGYSFDEVKGKHFWDLFLIPEEVEQVRNMFKKQQSGQFPNHYENYWLTRDGDRRLIAWSNTALFAPEGAVEYIIGTGIDITERKQTESALRESEERFDAFMNNSPAVAFMKDEQGRYVYVNKPLEYLFNVKLNDLLGKTDFDWLPEATAKQVHENDLVVLAENRTVEVIETVPTPNGYSRDWLVFKFPCQDVSGRRLLGGVAIDITERKQVEEALRQSEEQIRLFVEQMPAAVAIFDRDMHYLVTSRQWLTDYNLGDRDLIGCSHYEVFPDFPEHWKEISLRGLSGATHKCQEERFQLADGTTEWIKWELQPWRTNTNDIGGIIMFAEVITERKQTAAALQEANEKLTSWVKELEQRNREIVLLGEMNGVLQVCHTIEEAYSAIAQLMEPLFPQTSGAIFLINTSKNLVEAVATWGSSQLSSEKLFTPDECWALRRGRPNLMQDIHSGLACKHLHPNTLHTEKSLCVPMMAQGEALGVLYLSSAELGQLTATKQQLAVTVAEHIAISLANLKLRQTLQNQSIRDPLTGLFNRRYMDESLERELHRANRNQQPLGIVMLDVDHFKLFNDRFGHEAGDLVLQELGHFLQKHIRGSDIACRYGGEELMLILPGAPLKVVKQRAEQLRAGMKNLNLQHHHQALGTITVSLGIACFPEHGLTGEAVIRSADTALYCAKREGRDRVCSA